MATELAHQKYSKIGPSNEERDIRVEDYLNDKLQTSTDLAGIDVLLEEVKNQHLLLQQQVCVPLSIPESRLLTARPAE